MSYTLAYREGNACSCYVFEAGKAQPTPLAANDCGLDAPKCCSSFHIHQGQGQT